MKKLLLSGTALFSVLSLSAQVNVSTTPSNKVAVLEEYTGNYCTYCPDGHKIADQISATGAISLKIQTGGFSGTDPLFGGTLQTPTGNTIAGPFDSQGYPNGTVSRAPGNLGIGRGSWVSAVNAIQAQPSPVNLYIASDIDVTTGQLNVSVEYYYTAAEANATNYLHIGYYQDDIPAMQIDPLNLNPNQYYINSIDLYDFDHCFRDMVNGTWGEVVNTTGMGATGIINHTITLPASFNGFDIENGAIKVFAFMSTTSQGDILTAAKSTPAYNNFPNTDEIGIIYNTSLKDEDCIGAAGSFGPQILVASYGSAPLTAFNSNYGVNGGASTDAWTGNITHNKKTVVSLPAAAFTYQASNNLTIAVADPNGNTDPITANNTIASSFNGGAVANTDKIRIDASMDQYGTSDPSSFILYNGAGTSILSSGNIPNSTTTSYFYTLPVGTDCYKVKLIDGYGDSWGAGKSLKVYDVTGGANTLIHTVDASDFGSQLFGAMELTSAGSAAAIEELENEKLSVYPNPASDILNIDFNAISGDYSIELIDLQGRSVYSESLANVSGQQTMSISLANIAKGAYMIVMSSNNKKTVKNVVIK